jgi:hypothetical protein
MQIQHRHLSRLQIRRQRPGSRFPPTAWSDRSRRADPRRRCSRSCAGVLGLRCAACTAAIRACVHASEQQRRFHRQCANSIPHDGHGRQGVR